ncbi:hypothetical protein SAMN04487901_12149 [Prevotella communis]|uniref:Uncharacterized protein n=1 Tax=Prevotella communis TaxID=2913614 RepID=A0A1G8B0V0_9BACT|nr:hypothetical protein [Prevotella communis]SDH26755.1 hypothetical protein SAMN04487901_12149 [Prevotella communis]
MNKSTFNLYISDSVYKDIVNSEEQEAAGRSFPNKLLKQQHVQQLYISETEKLKSRLENVLKNPYSLYPLNTTSPKRLAIQRTYGLIYLSGEYSNSSPLIKINYIHINKAREKLEDGWDIDIKNILSELLPKHIFGSNYHATVIFDNMEKEKYLKSLQYVLKTVQSTYFYAVNDKCMGKRLNLRNRLSK